MTTYTSTNRFFITNPYGLQLDTDNIPFTSQKILEYINSIDRQEFDHDGNIIVAEYTTGGKYKNLVIAFPHDIWTSTGKIKKAFKLSLENKSFTDNYIPTDLSENTYENWKH